MEWWSRVDIGVIVTVSLDSGVIVTVRLDSGVADSYVRLDSEVIGFCLQSEVITSYISRDL